MAPTPTATQTKKNSSRRQDARISRAGHAEDEAHTAAAAGRVRPLGAAADPAVAQRQP